MALLEPGDIVDDSDRPGLDAAVITIDRLVFADSGILEVAGLLLGREEFDILSQRALITLQGQNVVGLLVDDLVGLVGDLDLSQHQTLAGGEGGDHVDGVLVAPGPA